MTILANHYLAGFSLNGRNYIKVVPGKNLFKSTMVHDVVNRGDCFAVDLESGYLTILSGNSEITVNKVDIEVYIEPEVE